VATELPCSPCLLARCSWCLRIWACVHCGSARCSLSLTPLFWQQHVERRDKYWRACRDTYAELELSTACVSRDASKMQVSLVMSRILDAYSWDARSTLCSETHVHACPYTVLTTDTPRYLDMCMHTHRRTHACAVWYVCTVW
jgi:hypothetical protein